MSWELAKSEALEQLREIARKRPGASIFVRDRAFSPSELISEVERETLYGRIYIVMKAKIRGIPI